MSGRKSSEVAAVLERAEKNRAATESNYRSAAENSLNSIRKHAETINEYQEELSAISAFLKPETKKELCDEVTALEKEVESLRQKASSEDYLKILQSLKKRFADYDNKLKELDDKAANVRRAVKEKRNGWYCDQEYAEAQKIQEQMKKFGNQKTGFLRELEKEENIAASEEIRIRNLIEQMKKYQKRAEELNQRAEDMIQLRQEAGKAKNCIHQLIKNINPEYARKFMPDNYHSLCNQAENFCKLSDADIVNGLTGMMQNISIFSMQLDAMYQAWNTAKEKTEQFLNKVKSMTKQGKFYHPNQYLANPETATVLNMFDFLSAYHDDEYEKQYNTIIQQAETLLAQEKFEESCVQLIQAENLLIEANAYAGTLQNQLIGSFQLAVDTRDIMHRAGFKVKTTFVNGKNACDGFCVKCSMGDESIDFQKVMMNDDGSVVMDIYHTEGANSCGTSWAVLQEKFNDAGIPMTDVKKNGKSIFNKQGGRTSDIIRGQQH